MSYQTFTKKHDTCPGCGYVSKTTEVKVRRVMRDDRDEAQLEITVSEVKGKRLFHTSASLTLTPHEARLFADALLQNHETLNCEVSTDAEKALLRRGL